jgi:hypothetical protein
MEQHRENCRKQHRMIAQYLSVVAWADGLDCVVLARADMERLLGLERFKAARVGWLMHDLRPWFAHQKAYYSTRASGSIHSLFLSRVPIDKHLPEGPMPTARRIAQMGADTPPTRLLSKARRAPTEVQIVSQLALLAAGLTTPQELEQSR